MEYHNPSVPWIEEERMSAIDHLPRAQAEEIRFQ
jgi:hypothetical protein